MSDPSPDASGAPLVQRISAVLWPAFVCAGAATGVFFTFFDPIVLLECEGEPPLSRMGAYTLGFFMFWLLCAASSLGTAYFLGTARGKPHSGHSP